MFKRLEKQSITALVMATVAGFLLAPAAEAQLTRTEIGGGQKVVYPGLFGPDTGGGDYINPKPFEPHVADGNVYMIVQGTPHHFNHPIHPSENCLGDELFLFKAPKANNRFLYAQGPAGGMTPQARISPCAQPGIEGSGVAPNFNVARGIVAGNVLYSSLEQEYFTVSTAAIPKASSSTGDEEFVEIMIGQTVNQQLDDWTWHSLFVIEQGLFGIGGTYLYPDSSRTPLAGHEYFRGYFRLLFGTPPQVANHAAEIRLDISNAWCGTSYAVSQSTPVTVAGGPCAKVEIRVGNSWKAVQNGAITSADVAPLGRPDIKVSNFAPWGLSKVKGQVELWGSKFLNVSQVPAGCTTPAPNWSVLQVSKFQYRDVAVNWSLGGPQEVDSNIRCMPSNTRIGRSYPWVFQPKGSSRTFLYSVSNDDVRTTGAHEFDGAYIVVTAIEDR